MQQNDLALVTHELSLRKAANPVSFFKPLSRQDQFLDDESDIRCVFGGNRSGKTEIGAVDTVRYALSMPKRRIWCVATTFADSVAIQQLKIWQYAPKKRITYGSYSDITGFPNRKLMFDNGSLITFKSYDQGRESFQGEKLHYLWFDEEPPFDIYRESKMRLIDYNGRMIITMTSLKGVTEVIDELYQGADIVEYRYGSLVDENVPVRAKKGNISFYMLWTTDNNHVRQERLVEDVKLMTPQEIKARVYGLPTNLQGLIFPTFSKEIHVLNDSNINFDDCQLWNILDPHDRKPWMIGWFAVNKQGQCIAVDEYPNKNFNEMLYDDKTYDDYVYLIKNKETNLQKNMSNKIIKRIIDPNFGNSTIQLAERQGGQSKTTLKNELKKRGLYYDDGIDALEDGHLKVREFLHYEIKNKQFTCAPKIYFSDRCQNIIRHLSKYSRVDQTTKSGEVRDTIRPADTYKDGCDIVRYFCMANPRYLEPINPVENKTKCY